MMRRLTFLTGFAAGYVLGARAGRERYEQIVRASQAFMGNPTVQHTTEAAKHQAGDLAGKASSTVKTQASTLAGSAKEKVSSKIDERRHGSGDAVDGTSSTTAMPRAEDSVYVVEIDEQVATGDGVTGTNDRMGL